MGAMTDNPPQRYAIDRTCSQCRAPAAPSHRYCGRCGSLLQVHCVDCDAIVAAGFDFCTNCGRPIGTVTVATAPSREERRVVSVLFVDLIGFTTIAEQLDPEDLRQLQVAYFATASGVIRRYGGIVEKYIGDAVMAVFGVPIETEHDALRAVNAGLELQRALDDQPLAGRYRMRATVGVATGEAFVDLAAARDGGEALVSGDVVATAARLQQRGSAGGVLVSAVTRRATYGSIRYAEAAERIQLPGKAGPIEVWRAESLVRRRLVQDEDTPLIGRQAELDLLVTAVIRCVRNREPQFVGVVGAHGVGKSRLVRELYRRVDASEDLFVRWRVGRCLPYGQTGVYGALAEIVKAQANVLDTDDAATAREQLSAALSDLFRPDEVERLIDLLGPLAGLPGRTVTPGEIEAAWRQVLLALAGHMPTVLVVEDLHFADPAVLRFLTDLMGSARDVPLFVLCTYRPELLDEHPGWASALPDKLTVSLGPLRGTQLHTLVSMLLRQRGLPERLTDRLARIVAGNPMYAVEYVLMLAERAAGEEPDLDVELAMPETVHGVIANRIDLLNAAARTVLHAAAVLGETVWSGAVAAMLDRREGDVLRVLHRLQRRDMLVPRSVSALAGETELTFRNMLVRDVAYRRLPRASRADLHRRAAGFFERMAIEGRHDMAAALAHHRIEALKLATLLGEDTATDEVAAREALMSAADAALAVYAVGSALGYVDQALNLWPTDYQVDRRRTCELLRCRLAFLDDSDRFYRDGGAKDVVRLVTRMHDAADRSGEARAETLLGQVELMRAERDRAREHLARAVALYADLPDDAAKAEAYGELSRLYMVEYRLTEALPAAAAARELAERLGLVDAAAGALVTQSMARYIGGDRGGLAELERATDMCRAQRLPALRRAAANLAVVLQEEGDLARSAELEVESAAAPGAQVSLVLSHSEEAELAWFTGDWTTLLRAAEEYLDSESAETTEWDLQLRVRRATLRMLRGENPGLELDRCLETGRRSGFSRLMFCALAYGAFGRCLDGDHAAAAELLAELASVWRRTPTGLTSEWLSTLAHTAALMRDARAAELVAEVVETAFIRTRWVAAAESLVAGARATVRGELGSAAARYAEAVERYDAIGAASDAALAAVWAVRAGADDPALAGRVRAFATRNEAPALIALTG
jgi:class 3 adenylate cyclase